MKVRLDKLESIHNNLRLDYYTGRCSEMPEVGKSFFMQTHQEGLLATTPVLSYEISFPERSVTFKTKHSTYKLTLLEK
jgi:hypothetical protein